MEFKISIFALVIILFLLHTIATHLFNWGYRFILKDNEENEGFILFLIFANLIELFIIGGLLQVLLN